MALVGESGSGKSVTAMSILQLLPKPQATYSQESSIKFNNKEIIDAAKEDLLSIRGNIVSMIFQEPMTSLNPYHRVGNQITESILLHSNVSKKEAIKEAMDLMSLVEIDARCRISDYPYQLSGGQRQRVMIAIALACEPKLLIADEPTTALDVTIQAEILALIDRLKRETGTAVMFITHDMAVVAQMADRVVVMFRGKKVEEGTVEEIFENPQHLYTKALLAAVPKLGEMSGKKYPEPMVKRFWQRSMFVRI